jgi:hypothetical protein
MCICICDSAAEVNVQPTVDAAVAQQAVKYYCMRQYNVGGKIHSQKNVTAGDEGVNQCAVACNSLKGECAGFGLSVNKCFLMKAFSSNSSAADATLDALCMKSANDWLDFGIQTCEWDVGGSGGGWFWGLLCGCVPVLLVFLWSSGGCSPALHRTHRPMSAQPLLPCADCCTAVPAA